MKKLSEPPTDEILELTIEKQWRKRVGVEPTGDGVTRHPPVLKNTSGVLIGYENFLLYLILQPLTSRTF